MSGASMWLDAPAVAGHTRSAAAAASCSARRTGFSISVTSDRGWRIEPPPEHPKLRGKQREAEPSRFLCPASGVGGTAVRGGDHGGMDEQASVLGALGEG